MAEHAYFSPSEQRSWITISDPTRDVLSTYPEGTIEVAMPPADGKAYQPRIDGEAFTWVEAEVPGESR